MNKVLLIIQREYITRVRKKAFIVMIFALPSLLLIMSGVIALVAKSSSELSEQQTIKVIDNSGIFVGKFHDGGNIRFQAATKPLAELKKDALNDENLSVLQIPVNFNKRDSVEIFSKKKPSFVLTGAIEKQMNDIAVSDGMTKNHIDTAVISAVKKVNVSLNPIQVTETGDKNANVGANMGVGITCAILVYLVLFIYGAQVMRGVIEEKTSRIIEVVISSVKPFQLMLGKIIGVGLVGLTQFAAWIILSIVASKIAGAAFSAPQGAVMGFLNVLKTIPFGYIMGVFFFYFVTGYLLYSALFAAVGAAVDSETETQQFMFPITMPLLFTYILSVSVLFQAPDSPLAVWLSIIPFTAPVAMMLRIPFGGVTTPQLIISMTLMIAGFLFTTYVASRVYRVGILMYGKKASFKEMKKWFFYKE